MTEPTAELPKSVHVRDITLGVLVLVMSMFLYYGAWAMTGFISIPAFMVLLICGWFARLLFRIGFNFIRGINVDIS